MIHFACPRASIAHFHAVFHGTRGAILTTSLYCHVGEGFSRVSSGGWTDHPGFPRKVEPRGYLSSIDVYQLYSLSVYLSVLSEERATDSFYHKDHGVHRSKSVGEVNRLGVLEGWLLWYRTGCLFCPVASQNFFFSGKPQFLLTRTPAG